MKVQIRNWKHELVECDLATALIPDISYDGGIAERANNQAEHALQSIAKLCAFMVERKLMTVTEAASICGVWHDDIQSV